MVRRWHGVVFAGLLLGGAACAQDSTTTSSFDVPTEIAISPPDFLGGVRCSPFEGGARSYVVTLLQWDSLDDDEPFVVGSSKPAPCSVELGFRTFVNAERLYSAEIDVYQEPAEELEPAGGDNTGARRMLRGGEPVVPRWRTQCGGGPSTATLPIVDRKSFIRPCDPLEAAVDAPTQLTFAPSDVLGETPCDVAPSLSLEVDLGEVTVPDELACDAEPLVVPLAPDSNTTLYVTATFLADGLLRGTSCTFRSAPGVTVGPTCAELARTGSLTLDPQALTAADDTLLCPPGGFFQVLEEGTPLNPVPLPCGQAAALAGLEPGPRVLELRFSDANGASTEALATCTALIEPGRDSAGVCEVVP